MGSGIAQVVAEAGLRVAWYDMSAAAVETGLDRIEAAWRRGVEKGRRSEAEVAAFRPRIVPAVDVAVAAATAALVIEAIVEVRSVKRSVFGMLSEAAPARAILASNTSSLSITEIAGATERPGQVIGLHFFNPVPVLPLVEIVRGLRTSDDTVERSVAFCHRLGKTPVVVNDAPGFVSNRILMPMINEAIITLSDGVATREAIDDVMKLGMAHPIGPLALADLIGLDVCLHILDTLQNDFGDNKYRPAPLLRRMVAAGLLGRKSGEGFYRYDGER
ncbi:MAG: 3-hydroxyacyl-CoA dehydrogenase NAD-binding domain-containing protein [Chloroflexota bacterium]|nr:3-hydroxyacyl-CoA dehydrogenase NAD-binding domain-containing protein [Chloroflexota bacterium]